MKARPDTLLAWTDPTVTRYAISRRFHNMLLKDFMLHQLLRGLDSLFAAPPPPGTGRYHHHDGMRT